MQIWPRKTPEIKEHPAGAAFFVGLPDFIQTERKAKSYVTDGYQRNPIVYRAIREITNAATTIDVELYNGDNLVESHPVLDLLANPSPMHTWDLFLSELVINRMMLGEMAAVGYGNGVFKEIWPVSPLNVEVGKGSKGLPTAYKHKVGQTEKKFDVDQITGQSDMLFHKMYNPTDYWRGQSPLMAAAIAADTHNEGSKWNYNLLRNSARPSGLIKFKQGYPAGEMVARMREYFKRAIQGSGNAGEIPMLADDAEWVETSHSPKDMDFLNTMGVSAKYVASALGVPLPLIDNDASTFNNLEQAKERLYTDTVIPVMNDTIQALGKWLLPRYGDNLQFKLDIDSIPALEALRERAFDRSIKAYDAGVLTLEESRDLIGYEPSPKGQFKPVTVPQQGEKGLPDLLHKLAYG